jgi:hydroxyethylthiazole kinase-like sugar kinase family protein
MSPCLANPRVLLYSIASEVAVAKPEVSGPGTFMSAFVDAIHHLSAGGYKWIENGNIRMWAYA